MFRNLRLYRVQSDWPVSEAALSEILAERSFQPCGAYTEQSAGWEAPGGEGEECLARRLAGADLMRLRIQSRLLPAAAVNEALEERMQQFEARMHRPPSRKEKRDLKDEVHAELMPRALLKSQRLWGMFIVREQVLAVDTSSEAQAELFLDTLRSAFGSLEAVPLSFNESLGRLLTRIFLGDGPTAFQPGRECRMIDAAAGKASVSWLDMELHSASVQKHVRDGLTLERLAVRFEEIITCVIDQQGVIRKFKLEGMDNVEDDAQVEDHPLALLDADFALTGGMVQRLLLGLKKELKGYG
ncbi:MAG: recombination-associated protein RdgC [Pseudomonadales bacterium]|nr:recombination-associated protein RdgC [Pseudomonadales bacterium]MCP5185098.1 recombination-associated protein RdgC [Pseudomonadales bacterium]